MTPRTALWVIELPASFVLGAVVGSFLNVVAYRVPLHLSIAAPRSFCPHCRHQLAWWENVPVVSWLVLRGRCRTCRAPISVRYLTVEVATGCVFAGVMAGWRGGFPTPGYFVLAAALVTIAVIERGGVRAPLSVAAVGTLLGAVALWIGATATEAWGLLGLALIGLAVGTGAFALLRRWDPDARSPATFGRSMLLPAGPWLAATGARPAGIGVAAGAAVYLVALAASRVAARRQPGVAGDPCTGEIGATPCNGARIAGRDDGPGCNTCAAGGCPDGTCPVTVEPGSQPTLPPLVLGVFVAVATSLLVR